MLYETDSPNPLVITIVLMQGVEAGKEGCS